MPGTAKRSRVNAIKANGTGNSVGTLPVGGPVRRCAFSLENYSQDDLIRFVRTPDGLAVPDIAAKLPGRGVWLKSCRRTLEKAIAANVFSCAFKAKTRPVDRLCDQVERQLVQRCIGLLGLARKSGCVITGFDKVRARIQGKQPGWLIEASDGAHDGRAKVYFLARALHKNVKMAGALTSVELGMAFGDGHVIHALLERGPLSDSFGIAYRRLTGFRYAPEENWFQAESENFNIENRANSGLQDSKRPGQT